MSDVYDDYLERVRAAVKERWADQGMCRSCGWHALFSEYGEIDWSDVDPVDGVVDLPCLADDGADHRGVRIHFRETDGPSGEAQ